MGDESDERSAKQAMQLAFIDWLKDYRCHSKKAPQRKNPPDRI